MRLENTAVRLSGSTVFGKCTDHVWFGGKERVMFNPVSHEGSSENQL